jgi:hypothetical protein
MMAVLSRLVDYSGLWERDLYFVALARTKQGGLLPVNTFTDKGLAKLKTGQIVAALDCNLSFRDDLFKVFGQSSNEAPTPRDIRNNFAHFNMLQVDPGQSLDLNLTTCVNDARRQMSYDRKLKNAVSQSIIELLGREGLTLTWTMDATVRPHALEHAILKSKQANHLGNKRVTVRGESQSITEHLHGDAYVKMVAKMFDATLDQQRNDVTTWDVNQIYIEQKRSKPHGKRPKKGHTAVSKNH